MTGGLVFHKRQRARRLLVLAGLGALIAALSILSIRVGEVQMSTAEVFAALTGRGDELTGFVVNALRLPRVLTGVAAGIALGMSGAILQSLTRNPLASPEIVGFNAGAAFGAVSGIWLWGGGGATLGAVLGGLGVAALVLALSWQNGFNPLRLILVGIGLGMTLYAGVNFLVTRTDLSSAAQATQWLMGSVNARHWGHVAIAGGGLAVLMPLALMLQRGLDRLALGADTATGLGIRVAPVRLMAALVSVLLAAVAVSVVGPIAFVAFIAGPIARRLVDAPGPNLLAAGLVGALVLIGADLAGRVAVANAELPAGIFTAFLGAPYLLWLLATQIRRGDL